MLRRCCLSSRQAPVQCNVGAAIMTGSSPLLSPEHRDRAPHTLSLEGGLPVIATGSFPACCLLAEASARAGTCEIACPLPSKGCCQLAGASPGAGACKFGRPGLGMGYCQPGLASPGPGVWAPMSFFLRLQQCLQKELIGSIGPSKGCCWPADGSPTHFQGQAASQ